MRVCGDMEVCIWKCAYVVWCFERRGDARPSPIQFPTRPPFPNISLPHLHPCLRTHRTWWCSSAAAATARGGGPPAPRSPAPRAGATILAGAAPPPRRSSSSHPRSHSPPPCPLLLLARLSPLPLGQAGWAARPQSPLLLPPLPPPALLPRRWGLPFSRDGCPLAG